MSSHSSDCVEVFPTTEESSSSVDLERLARELSPASSEHVLPSSDRGIYIPELGRRICSINQLTRQQRASLTEDQPLQVLSFMANFPSALESSSTHRHGRGQPVEEDNSLSDHSEVSPSGAEQDTTSKVRNVPAGPGKPAQPARGGRMKACAQWGRTRGRRALEEEGDPVRRGEDAARSLS